MARDHVSRAFLSFGATDTLPTQVTCGFASLLVVRSNVKVFLDCWGALRYSIRLRQLPLFYFFKEDTPGVYRKVFPAIQVWTYEGQL